MINQTGWNLTLVRKMELLATLLGSYIKTNSPKLVCKLLFDNTIISCSISIKKLLIGDINTDYSSNPGSHIMAGTEKVNHLHSITFSI